MIMKIDHLINGKSIAGRDYFETVNPATQEVLAEVAAGGETEVKAAVEAAKEAFPKWAGMAAPQRAQHSTDGSQTGCGRQTSSRRAR